jgi:chemotaxis protein MotA
MLGGGVIGWTHLASGGDLSMFVNAPALAVVFGGTAAALLVSFPARTLREAATGLVELMTRSPKPLAELVPAFIGYARKARRQGLMAVEAEVERAQDDFLARALALAASGMPAAFVRDALDIEARVCAEREECRAEVLEAAAGYAPTLGIVGAVLGLMHVMDRFTSGDAGAEIAMAFVATLYGVGAANLIFLPLASRLRIINRREALRRELVTDGVLALHDGAAPAVVGERLSGYLREPGRPPLGEVA